jgi:hypothetical protein
MSTSFSEARIFPQNSTEFPIVQNTSAAGKIATYNPEALS